MGAYEIITKFSNSFGVRPAMRTSPKMVTEACNSRLQAACVGKKIDIAHAEAKIFRNKCIDRRLNRLTTTISLFSITE